MTGTAATRGGSLSQRTAHGPSPMTAICTSPTTTASIPTTAVTTRPPSQTALTDQFTLPSAPWGEHLPHHGVSNSRRHTPEPGDCCLPFSPPDVLRGPA